MVEHRRRRRPDLKRNVIALPIERRAERDLGNGVADSDSRYYSRVERLSAIGHGQAEFANFFLKFFTRDILGATRMLETGRSKSNQNASRGTWESPWPPFL
jgi:hypothetical protein